MPTNVLVIDTTLEKTQYKASRDSIPEDPDITMILEKGDDRGRRKGSAGDSIQLRGSRFFRRMDGLAHRQFDYTIPLKTTTTRHWRQWVLARTHCSKQLRLSLNPLLKSDPFGLRTVDGCTDQLT